MDVYPELLTHLAVRASKRFLAQDGKTLSEVLAKELAEFEQSHKTTLTTVQLRTVCQMANRATHKKKFAKDRHVKFDLTTPESVRGAAPKPVKPVKTHGPMPSLENHGRSAVIASGKPIEKKASMFDRDALPGRRKVIKAQRAEDVAQSVRTLVRELEKTASADLPPEEVLGLAVVLESKSGGVGRLTQIVNGVLDRISDGVDLEKVASFTGMTPDETHPLVQSMNSLLHAAAEYAAASRATGDVWVDG